MGANSCVLLVSAKPAPKSSFSSSCAANDVTLKRFCEFALESEQIEPSGDRLPILNSCELRAYLTEAPPKDIVTINETLGI